MQEQFLDRILSCVDCHGEFIFTAGEQLFFFDKQFKNDPKRCKPCKSRRSGLAAVANGTGPVAAGLSRTETRTHCSDCGVETTVPFKPTQGRPVLCRQCFQVKSRAVPTAVLPAAQPPGSPTLQSMAQEAATLTALSGDSHGLVLSAEAALLAASSMAAASPKSSVATSADLASLASLQAGSAVTPDLFQTPAQLAARLIACSPAEFIVSAQSELQSSPVDANQA